MLESECIPSIRRRKSTTLLTMPTSKVSTLDEPCRGHRWGRDYMHVRSVCLDLVDAEESS